MIIIFSILSQELPCILLPFKINILLFEKELACICWFTPEMPAMSRVGLGQTETGAGNSVQISCKGGKSSVAPLPYEVCISRKLKPVSQSWASNFGPPVSSTAARANACHDLLIFIIFFEGLTFGFNDYLPICYFIFSFCYSFLWDCAFLLLLVFKFAPYKIYVFKDISFLLNISFGLIHQLCFVSALLLFSNWFSP